MIFLIGIAIAMGTNVGNFNIPNNDVVVMIVICAVLRHLDHTVVSLGEAKFLKHSIHKLQMMTKGESPT
jgi:hypothetical protein